MREERCGKGMREVTGEFESFAATVNITLARSRDQGVWVLKSSPRVVVSYFLACA